LLPAFFAQSRLYYGQLLVSLQQQMFQTVWCSHGSYWKMSHPVVKRTPSQVKNTVRGEINVAAENERG